ncbi:MAG: hypothetical protein RIB60_04800 [Phycisphaerales bacterium]
MTETPETNAKTESADPTPPPAPTPIRWGVLLASLAAGCVAAAGAVYALVGFERPVLGMFGFELVAAIAGVLGVMLGLGRFREGFGLGALCVAGTFVAAALFGLYLDANANVSSAEGTRMVKLAILAHVGFGGAIAALGGIAVLLRSKRSWGMLIKGVLIASPAVLIAAWLQRTNASALTTELGPNASMARAIGVVMGAVVLMVLFSVGAHLCIRAFETTRPDDKTR